MRRCASFACMPEQNMEVPYGKTRKRQKRKKGGRRRTCIRGDRKGCRYDLPDGVSDGSDLCMPVCGLCEKRSVPAGGVGFRQLLHGADLSYLL